MGIVDQYELRLQRLRANGIFKHSDNNKYVLEFVLAKQNGGYKRLNYKLRAESPNSILRLIQHLLRVEDYLDKPFHKVTEKDIVQFRDDLNHDKVFKKKTITKNKKGFVPEINVVRTKEPLSFDTKRHMRNAWVLFWEFLTEYFYHKWNKSQLPDINKFFKLSRGEDYRSVKVDFIPADKLNTFLEGITNRDFKALVMFCLTTGARPIEVINVKMGTNIYRNEGGEWVQHLPNIKRVSYKKFPFKIFMYEEELVPYFNMKEKQLKTGDKVFNISSQTFYKLMRYYSKKTLGKTYTPKILRKTTRMLLEKTSLSPLEKRKIMGHSPDSTIDLHYTNYDGINLDDVSLGKLTEYTSPTLKQQFDELKLKDLGRDKEVEQLKESQRRLVKILLKEIQSRGKVTPEDLEDFATLYGSI